MVAKKKKEEKGKTMESLVKEIEKNIFSIRFYPVAVNRETKEEAVGNIKKIYNEGNETGRQLLLYMIHENISEFMELKISHTFEFMKARNPQAEPSQLRMNVYKKMFNYNTSLEGIMELLDLLHEFEGDDAAKLLTYHYSRFCAMESEANIVLRNAALEALGKSKSPYALNALLEYARNTDNEKTLQRIVSALTSWEEKIDKIKMPAAEKKKLKSRLSDVLTKELKVSHYG